MEEDFLARGDTIREEVAGIFLEVVADSAEVEVDLEVVGVSVDLVVDLLGEVELEEVGKGYAIKGSTN